MRSILLFAFLLTLTACPPKEVVTKTPTKAEPGYRIAFGSCNNQDEPQPLWHDIANEGIAMWIWLGDNIYADTEDMGEMKRMYDKQKVNARYKAFREAVPTIIGTWDDHDYGINDGGKEFAQKERSRDLALEFLDVPKTSAVWNREGLYQSYELEYQDKTIRAILLDCRYFKDPIKRTKKGYEANEDAELLGEAQWQWLEEELKKEEDLLIVASGVQIIPEEHRFEKWANFPTERARLFNLLKDENAQQIVLLSGDRHIGEISRVKAGDQTIYEVTSSGLTHSYEAVGDEPNRHRISKLTGQLNYGLLNIDGQGSITLSLSTKGGELIDQVTISKKLK